MKKGIHHFCLLSFLSLLLLSYSIDISAQVTFQKTFGGALDDKGHAVQQTFDGGYIIAGATESFGAGGSDIILIKTDQNGSQLWAKTYGGTSNEDGNGLSIIQTLDSGFVVVGHTTSFGAIGIDLYVFKNRYARKCTMGFSV